MNHNLRKLVAWIIKNIKETHTLFTQYGLIWPNMGQSYHFWCLQACSLAGESLQEIIRVIQLLLRAMGLGNRGQMPLQKAKGPRKPSAQGRMMALKGPSILEVIKRLFGSNITPNANMKRSTVSRTLRIFRQQLQSDLS